MNNLHLGDPVYDFLIENKKNLQLAGQVVKAWPKVRDSITRQFLGQIERSLRSKLPKDHDWKLETGDFDVFNEQWPQPIQLSKAIWHEDFLEPEPSVSRIALEVQGRGKKAVMGVWREKEKAGAVDSKLVEAFRKIGIAGRSNQYWAIQVDLPKEVVGWRDSGVLCRMKFESDKWAETIAESMFAFAKTAEPIIDQLFKSKISKTR